MSEQTGEFLTHWQSDARLRWSGEDFAAQQEFVNDAVAGGDWADWSTPSAAMQLIQASLLGTPLEDGEKTDAIVLAGPVVELVAPAKLFGMAAGRLNNGGRLAGIVPCLRDNSPESALFMELAEAQLWPYCVEEEVREALDEAGFETAGAEAKIQFVAIPQFNRAVLNDEPGFKGFRQLFKEMEKQGYDPIEVGWGELRFAADLGKIS